MNTTIRLTGLAGALSLALAAYAGGAAAQSLYGPLNAYVPSAAEGTVSAIDIASETVAWTLKVGERASHGIAASPDGSIVYAGDDERDEVVVIDAESRAVLKRIPVAFSLHGIDISPDGRTLWAGGQRDNDPVKGTLAAIDTARLAVTGMVSPTLGAASHLAVTPDSQEVWIASTSTNLVWVVDAASRQVAAVVPLALPESEQRPAPGDDWGAYLEEKSLIGLNEIAISPDGKTAYAVGPAVSELFAIDVETRQVKDSVHAGERAHGVTVRPNGKEVWIADWAGTVNVFDAATLEPLYRIPVVAEGADVSRGANHIAFSPDGGRVYVTGADEVVVIDPGSRTVAGRMAVGAQPHEISLEDWVLPTLMPQAGPREAQSLPPRPTGAPKVMASAAARPPLKELVRSDDQRAVWVDVTPLNLWEGGETLNFNVALNTHSVDLDYDFAGLASLHDDAGNSYRAVAWDGPKGGHHLTGVLRFPDADRILAGKPDSLELRLDGVADARRVFRWDLGEMR